jgi:hypothetical protein
MFWHWVAAMFVPNLRLPLYNLSRNMNLHACIECESTDRRSRMQQQQGSISDRILVLIAT